MVDCGRLLLQLLELPLLCGSLNIANLSSILYRGVSLSSFDTFAEYFTSYRCLVTMILRQDGCRCSKMMKRNMTLLSCVQERDSMCVAIAADSTLIQLTFIIPSQLTELPQHTPLLPTLFDTTISHPINLTRQRCQLLKLQPTGTDNSVESLVSTC